MHHVVGRGGHMAARACEPAGHEGRSASLAPCVRARAQRKAKHMPGGLWRAPKGPATDFSPWGLQMGSKHPLPVLVPFLAPYFSVEAMGTLNALNTQLEETKTFGDHKA
jgi:hypothetical protein